MQWNPDFILAHVGINADSEVVACKIASQFNQAFGLVVKVGGTSVFAGTEVEVMKQDGPGKMGHIAFSTAEMNNAMEYIRDCGFSFDESLIKRDAEGNVKAAYLSEDFGGFRVHLVAR